MLENSLIVFTACYAFFAFGHLLLSFLGKEAHPNWLRNIEITLFLFFTVWLAFSLQQYANGYLLFVWCLQFAQILSVLIYRNNHSATFSHMLSFSLLLFTYSYPSFDKNWLSLDGICYLLGYGFSLLALPHSILYLWGSQQKRQHPVEKKALFERYLWSTDRMIYRMILWALPCLTIGILLEGLILLERQEFHLLSLLFSRPEHHYTQPLIAWFLCGFYLHMRIFGGFINRRSAHLYLTNLLLFLISNIRLIYS